MAEIPKSDYGKVQTPDKAGFVIGNISCHPGGRGTIRCTVTDEENVVCQAEASAHYYRPSDAQVRYNSLTVPVRPGQRYIVQVEHVFAKVDTQFFFVER
jgi:hypothetical protein